MFLTLNLKLHFDGKDAEENLNLGDRKNSRKKNRKERDYGEEAKKEEEAPKKAFPPFILPSLHFRWAHISFDWAPSCFGQSIMPFQTLRLEDLAALTLINFLKIKRQKPCKINSSQCTNILETASYERVEEMLCSRGQ